MKFSLNNSLSIKSYRKNLNKRIQNIKKDFLIQMYNRLLKYTPVSTGRLVNGYQLDLIKFQIKNEVQYLWFVNNGTIYQVGQHFVQISYQQTLQKLQSIIKKYKE